MQVVPRQCSIRHIIINPAEICYLRFTLEAYEGIAMISTIDSQLGLVRVSIAPGCEEDVESILIAEQESLGLRRVSIELPPSGQGDSSAPYLKPAESRPGNDRHEV